MPTNKEVRKLELCDIAPYLQYDLIHTGKTWADQIDIVEITEECTKIKVEYSFDKKPYTLYISFLDLVTHVYRMN